MMISSTSGYHNVSLIPAGATNIDIQQHGYQQLRDDENYLGKNIRIYHEYVDRIDNSFQRVTVWHHKALLLMTNSDPGDRFIFPFLKLVGFFSMHTFRCHCLNNFSFTLKYFAFMSAILKKTDILTLL